MGRDCANQLARPTAAPENRRRCVIFPARLSAVLATALSTGLAFAAPAAATAEDRSADWQPVNEIAAAAETFVLASAGDGGSLVATAGHLDPRLKLSRCTKPIEPFVRPGSRLSGRIVVGVRCTGAKPWKVYLPVHVGVFQDVIVASRPLPRGHLLQTGDFELARRDVSGIASEYLSDPDDVLGRRLTRSVTSGLVLATPLLHDQTLISRGQTVTLNAGNGAINIRMAGVAVSDGRKDQLIHVRNATSGKIVEGRVRSASVVEVLSP